MTQQKFDEINNHFNSLIGENGLLGCICSHYKDTSC
jgi:hypothetical protein